MHRLPKSATTVTLFSKLIALFLLLAFSLGSFLLGTHYQQRMDLLARQMEEALLLPEKRIPTPTPQQEGWKTYEGDLFSFKYPNNWYLINPGKDGTRSINVQNYQELEVTKEEKRLLTLNPTRITVGTYDKQILNNQSLIDWLKSSRNYTSAMVGDPIKVETIMIAQRQGVKLTYTTNNRYIVSDGKEVFYLSYLPTNTQQKTTFDQILSSFKLTNSQNSYVCPRGKTIDCMPTIGEDKHQQCSKDYLSWVNQNCPGVTVAY